MTTIYELCISNTVAYIRGPENRALVKDEQGISMFVASTVLAAAFCKTKEDVFADLLGASKLLSKESS